MRREVAPRPGLSRLIDKARRLAMTFLLSTLVASHRARASIVQIQAAHRRALALRAVACQSCSPQAQHAVQLRPAEHLEADELHSSARALQPQGVAALAQMSLPTFYATSSQGTDSTYHRLFLRRHPSTYARMLRLPILPHACSPHLPLPQHRSTRNPPCPSLVRTSDPQPPSSTCLQHPRQN